MFRYPESPGTFLQVGRGAQIDYSRTNQGYVVGSYLSDGIRKVKMVCTHKPSQRSQTYAIPSDGRPKAFPLCFSDGEYVISIYHQVEGAKYQTDSTIVFNVKLDDPLLPWLYPNTFCAYDKDSPAVKMVQSLFRNVIGDGLMMKVWFYWIIENISYDKKLAATVKGGWIPNPNQVLEAKQSICWGYSSLFAVLRAMGIPVRIVVGHAGTTYHSWNEVYIKSGIQLTPTWYVKGGQWTRLDLTFLDGGTKPLPSAEDFVKNDANYKVEYYG